MSGTLGSIRRKKLLSEESKRKIIEQYNKQAQLKSNRDEIIAEICKTFGWTKLDDFAQKMIDDAVSGQIVDIEKLKEDLAKWKEEQEVEDASVSS